MDNLRAAIEVLFVDTEFDKVIHSLKEMGHTADCEVNKENFAQSFLNRNRMFGTDVIQSIGNIVCDSWMKSDTSKESSVFYLLTHATDKMLEWENDNPVCHYEDYLRWNELTDCVGEDLLITAFLAKRSICSHQANFTKSFAWKPYIITDSSRVNEILQKGLSELHYHLTGSSHIFSVNWLALMNGAYKKWTKQQKKLNPKLFQWVTKAAAIRFYLTCKLHSVNQDIDDIRKSLYLLLSETTDIAVESVFNSHFLDKIVQYKHTHGHNFNGVFIDYAIPQRLTAIDEKRFANIPLVGERKFLYDCFVEIFKDRGKSSETATLLYAYIIAKNQFWNVVIQQIKTKGFSHFQKIQDRKGAFVTGDYVELFAFLAVQPSMQNQPIQNLEMRIAPKKNSRELKKAINKNNNNINSRNFIPAQYSSNSQQQLGYIIHFIKKKDKVHPAPLGNCFCRNEHLRNEIWRQSQAIGWLIKRDDEVIQKCASSVVATKQPKAISALLSNNGYSLKGRIVGIDAASSEFNARAEVFAPSYRYLKSIKANHTLAYIKECHDQSLGFTFHAGEDFYDIVDGLRAIQESVYFLNLGKGDRLGHCVALGIDVEKYYRMRHFQIAIPKQVLLDNAVWLIVAMDKYSIQDKNGLRYRLENIVRKVGEELYALITNHYSYRDYYESWLLRGDKPLRTDTKRTYPLQPYFINHFIPEIDAARLNANARMLYVAYHYNGKAKDAGLKTIEYKIEETDVLVIEELQRKLQAEIAKRQIAVETNPTSNRHITDVNKYSEHPILNFNHYALPLRENQEEREALEVSINTDDQGVFSTSLEKEFTLMALALEKEKDKNGQPIYNREDIYQWLDYIRAAAFRQTFIKQ